MFDWLSVRRSTILLLTIVIAVLACNFPGVADVSPSSMPPASVSTSPTPTAIPASPTPTASPISTIAYTPALEPTACRFYVPEGTSPLCGDLVVPENRQRPDSPSIRLHVAIFTSVSSNPAPDPVIHLGGGPGSPTTDWAGYLFDVGLDGFLRSRSYVLFDQRGTGNSLPRLNCPERDDLTVTLLTQQFDDETAANMAIDAYARCRDRLRGEGIDLSAYNSAASAADINDLRLVLGYDKINLYGVSYGTRLALTSMRDYPETLRSVILDSPYPPQVHLYTTEARYAERAFNVLFDGCAADPACNAAYPDLRNVFYQLAAQLEAAPVTVDAYDSSRGTPVSVLVDGDVLIDVLFSGLYRMDTIPSMPALIDETRQANTARLSRRLGLFFDRAHSTGMTNSVECNEEVPFGTVEEMLADNLNVQPLLRDHFNTSLEAYFKVCDAWGAGRADPIENQPVTSDIPTLLLAGEYDPITPPEWATLTAETLPNSTVYQFPGWGHWIMRSGQCGINIGLEFMDNPTATPDASCIASMGPPAFVK
jgi:pimeloyl-ACP methyl ester carboxylesterase